MQQSRAAPVGFVGHTWMKPAVKTRDTQTLTIRAAVASDSARLTDIAYSAKRHWRYPAHYIERWRAELTITEAYLAENIVRCVNIENEIVGFYSIVVMKEATTFGEIVMDEGPWLDHMFIFPDLHRKGIGTFLFVDLRTILMERFPGQSLKIFVDPNAVGFYERMGAKLARYSASSIPNRTIPVFQYNDY